MPAVAFDIAHPPITVADIDKVVRLLARERTMNIAFVRPDGWPQVTTVGYISDGLDIYFTVSQQSQKLANLRVDARASIAIHAAGDDDLVGVSMAGVAVEVYDPAEIQRINVLIVVGWPGVSVFCPAGQAVAIIHVRPQLIGMIRIVGGQSRSDCFSVDDSTCRASASPVLDAIRDWG